MQSIRVTPETLAQYRADCRADRRRELRQSPPPDNFEFKHDPFLFGRVVFVPAGLLDYRFSSEELHALAH